MLRGIPFEEKKRQIVELARALIDGRIHAIEGSQRLCGLFHELDDPACRELHKPFIAIASETDHLPLGEFRGFCAPEFLRKADSEIEEYLAVKGPSIVEACRRVVTALAS